MKNIAIFLSSRNNYSLLEDFISRNEHHTNEYYFVNVYDFSYEYEIQLGKSICEKIKGHNTNIKGYTYNPVLVNEKASDNISNHRVLTDPLSLNILLFEKTTKQIFIPYPDYAYNKKNNNNFLDYLFDSHLTSIIRQNPSKQILIPIAFCKS